MVSKGGVMGTVTLIMAMVAGFLLGVSGFQFMFGNIKIAGLLLVISVLLIMIRGDLLHSE